mgnify:CR=1 FL=1
MSLSQFPADAKVLAREMKPALDALEQGRLKSLARISQGWKKITITVLIMIGVSVLILAITTSLATSRGNEMVFLVIPVGLIGIIYCAVIHHKFISGHKAIYCAVYKEKVIGGMTRLIQPDMTYSPDRGISEKAFMEMGLYSTGIDRYHSEDLFAGKIGKTAIMFSEAHAEEKRTSRDSKGRKKTRWVTIFRGLLTIVDFNKNFRSWVTVKPDFAESTFGWFGRKIQGFSANLVRLENPEFEDAFVVHGGDQVEARYILTPDMQDRLLDLRKWFGDDIRIAFHNSRMHLTIPNSDNWFEPNINRSAHDTTQMQMFLRQMSSVFRLVEMLDLNTRIWTKD